MSRTEMTKEDVLLFLGESISAWWSGSGPRVVLECHELSQASGVGHIIVEAEMIHERLSPERLSELRLDEPALPDLRARWAYHFEIDEGEQPTRFDDIKSRPWMADEAGWFYMRAVVPEEDDRPFHVCWKGDVIHVVDDDLATTWRTWFGVR